MYTVLRDFIFWQVRIENIGLYFLFAQTFTALFDDQFRSLNDDMNGKNVAEENRWQKSVRHFQILHRCFSCMEDLNPNTIYVES